jgi:tetratricopeptide (TPR) repeat protein
MAAFDNMEVSQFGFICLQALAEEHIALGNLEDAEKLATKAMEIARHTGEENSIYAAYAEGILADALYHMGSFKEAADHYHSALKSYERHSLGSR